MKLPELNNLYDAFADCLLTDNVTPTEIYEVLMETIDEQEKYFQEQLQRVQDVKNLVSKNMPKDYMSQYFERLKTSNRL